MLQKDISVKTVKAATEEEEEENQRGHVEGHFEQISSPRKILFPQFSALKSVENIGAKNPQRSADGSSLCAQIFSRQSRCQTPP